MYRKNIKSTKIQKIPGCQLWVQKSKGEQNIKRAKNSRKGTGAGYFTQNFQKMYRDFTKNQTKKQGVSVISLCELVIVILGHRWTFGI